MSEEDIIQEVQKAKRELIKGLESKTFWDRVLPVLQTVILLGGGVWAVFTYYVDRHERSHRPATIAVQAALEDLGPHEGLRFVKVQISVENKGARAFVINSPYTVRAQKMNPASPGQGSKGSFWNGSFAGEKVCAVLRSGEAFGRGYWFDPGEIDSRSYVVAFPEGAFDLLEVEASVRHSKLEDDAVHTRWEAQPDHSLRAITVVLTDKGHQEYSRQKHAGLWDRDGIAMNDSSAYLALWTKTQVIAVASSSGSGKGIAAP